MRARTDHAAASMRQGTVHVWQADTATDPPDAAALLSPDEQARAARFRRPADRTRFAASHVALRHILAAYLSPERPEHGAGALRFAVTAQGKPHLIRPASAPDLRFSLSHSGDLALIAITFGREVGVDVEAERPIPDVLRLAERVAAPHEREALRALDEPLRAPAFLRLWVSKEAVLKARGTGLHADPRQVLLDGHGDAPMRLRHAGGPGAWSLVPYDAPAGYHAALVTAGDTGTVTRHTWTPPPARSG